MRDSDLRSAVELKRRLEDRLRERFDIEHATLEFELSQGGERFGELVRKDQ